MYRAPRALVLTPVNIKIQLILNNYHDNEKFIVIKKSPLPSSAGGPIVGDSHSKAGGDEEPATGLPIPDLVIAIITAMMTIIIAF